MDLHYFPAGVGYAKNPSYWIEDKAFDSHLTCTSSPRNQCKKESLTPFFLERKVTLPASSGDGTVTITTQEFQCQIVYWRIDVTEYMIRSQVEKWDEATADECDAQKKHHCLSSAVRWQKNPAQWQISSSSASLSRPDYSRPICVCKHSQK